MFLQKYSYKQVFCAHIYNGTFICAIFCLFICPIYLFYITSFVMQKVYNSYVFDDDGDGTSIPCDNGCLSLVPHHTIRARLFVCWCVCVCVYHPCVSIIIAIDYSLLDLQLKLSWFHSFIHSFSSFLFDLIVLFRVIFMWLMHYFQFSVPDEPYNYVVYGKWTFKMLHTNNV